ncbi:MAG: protein-disulfide reductase DsbD family protein, partial [Adhaeribacter sp.]
NLEFSPLQEQAAAQQDSASQNPVQTLPVDMPAEGAQSSLWLIFIAGLAGGFAAFLMPCIFPMVPLTVSYFTKNASSRKGGIIRSAVYGLSIIFIYVGLGMVVTLLFGADALNALATNGIFNFLFFLMLVVFAASFLGAFEITLPASWANKADAKSDRGGYTGIFFMAATLALVSFSCTGPIIGTLLVQAASSSQLLAPAVGMLGFAIALAVPFVLFSLFPSWISALPRAGGWLHTFRVSLGFVELALALKFLSNVDLAYHWEWLDREVFLSLWIIIFGLMGLYLLGKLRLGQEPETAGIPIPRLLISMVVLAFSFYMVPGLWGAPLKAIAPLLPPQGTQDFDLYTNAISFNPDAGARPEQAKKYGDIFHAPLNLDAFFDYEQGMAYARKVNKPVLLDFTGHACVNCRKMEATVWPDKQVLRRLQQDYVLIQLYVDDKTQLPENEQKVSSFSGNKIKTIGNKWSDFQASRFKANSQPFYVLLDHQEELLTQPQGANYDPLAFSAFLDAGKERFQNPR